MQQKEFYLFFLCDLAIGSTLQQMHHVYLQLLVLLFTGELTITVIGSVSQLFLISSFSWPSDWPTSPNNFSLIEVFNSTRVVLLLLLLLLHLEVNFQPSWVCSSAGLCGYLADDPRSRVASWWQRRQRDNS